LVAALDQPAQLGDLTRLALGERRLVGLAALARPEPGALGGGRRVMECDILGPGRARGARRTAVHPGGLHRVDERAVGPRVGAEPADRHGLAAAGIAIEPGLRPAVVLEVSQKRPRRTGQLELLRPAYERLPRRQELVLRGLALERDEHRRHVAIADRHAEA